MKELTIKEIIRNVPDENEAQKIIGICVQFFDFIDKNCVVKYCLTKDMPVLSG